MEFRFYKDRVLRIINVKKTNFFTQFIGLMFSRRKTYVRLFSYKSDRRVSVHSWFVFYKFLIVWLDSKNRVVSWKIVKPFTSCVLPKKKCRAFLEIPLDAKYSKDISFVVGKRQTFKYN